MVALADPYIKNKIYFPKVMSFDCETTGLDLFHGCKPFLIVASDLFGSQENYSWWGRVNIRTREVTWDREILDEIQLYLDNAEVLVFHNSQFDLRCFEVIGLKIDHLWAKVEDTQVMSHIICPGDMSKEKGIPSTNHALKKLAFKYFGWADDEEKALELAVKTARKELEQKGYCVAKYGHPYFPTAKKQSKFWKSDYWLVPETCLEYAYGDVERTLLLYREFKKTIERDQLWSVYKERKAQLRILYGITSAGMQIDREKAENKLKEYARKILARRKYVRNELNLTYTPNFNKKDQIRMILRHVGIEPNWYTEKGQEIYQQGRIPNAQFLKTDDETLEWYFAGKPHPVLRAVMQARKYQTLYNYLYSYLQHVDSNWKIHSTLNLTGTKETRQSSESPNQQNITATLDALFLPPPGFFWLDSDAVNIELRLWAYAVGNKELIALFEQGKSVHKMIMNLLYPSEYKIYSKGVPEDHPTAKIYRNCKAGTFALIYGATEAKADSTYGYEGATKKIYEKFPGIKEYTDKLIATVEGNKEIYGYPSVFTLLGYRLDVPPNEPFKACNYNIQGTAGQVMGKMMLAVDANPFYQESGSRMIQQVHDKLRIEIPINKWSRTIIDEIKKSMSTCVKGMKTPVDEKIRYRPEDKQKLQELGVLSA